MIENNYRVGVILNCSIHLLSLIKMLFVKENASTCSCTSFDIMFLSFNNVQWPRRSLPNSMTPGEGAPLLGHGHIGHIVNCIISLKIFFSSSGHRLDKLRVYHDDRGGVPKFVNLMTRGVRILVLEHNHILKFNISSPFLVYIGAWIRQINYI